MNIEAITELIQDYEYGQYNLGEQDLTIQYDSDNKRIAIENFYQHGTRTKTGTCSELMNTCYQELRKQYPELHIFRTIGQEPRHFYESFNGTQHAGASHCFLLVSPYSLTGYLPVVESTMKLHSVIETNPLVVDPSFKYVSPLEKTGYFPRKLIKPGSPDLHSNQLVFRHENGRRPLVPLGINERDEMAYLEPNWELGDLLQVTVHGKDKFSKSFTLDDDRLKDMFAKQPKLLRTFHRLARAPRKQGVNIIPETIIIQ